MKASELLRSALEKFGEDGSNWVNGPPGHRLDVFPSGYCSITALGNPSDDQYDWARSYLREFISGYSIVAWNDAPGRTFAEVKAAFEKAIVRAEGDEQ